MGNPKTKPDTLKTKANALLDWLWRWLLAPSPRIAEHARGQASLLSGFLIGTILLAVVTELLTVAFIDWKNYTGYRQTVVVVIGLGIIYAISRTQRVQLAAFLAVVVASAGVYFIGWSEPKSVLGGLFDFMILPLWLGSLYFGLRGLAALISASLVAILSFPLLSPQVTFDQVLVGPFSFILVTSILLIVITHYRNRLEQGRGTELAERENRSGREAARTQALLRVAERLNAELDLDALLQALGEEVAQAINTPISLVMIYSPKENNLFPAAGAGLTPAQLKSLSPLSKEIYDQTLKEFGPVFALPDLQTFNALPHLDDFKRLNLRSIAFATMRYRQELIGSLNAITRGESRGFSEDELLLLQGIADQAGLAITNTRLYKDARRRLENLQGLRAIDIAIASNHDLREALAVLLEQITKQLLVDAAVILLLDENMQELEFGASQGFQATTLHYQNLHIGEGMAGRAAQDRQFAHVRDLRSDPQFLVNAPLLAREGFVSYYVAPLICQGQVKGVLEIFQRSVLDPDDEWSGFLETLAGQAAIAIESTTLFEDLQRSNDELSQAYDSTIEGWSRALDLRDRETEGHTRRVTELTMELARVYGISDRELVYIRWGALLHDIGKMGVPDSILLKAGPLTEAEWVTMREHPIYAHNMLRTIQYLSPALDIPYCHHEKWDGTGYPRGLKGEEIPLKARIFAVADVWDALTSDRPYRAAWPPEKALAHILEGAGTHFDPGVVQMFADLIRHKTGQ